MSNTQKIVTFLWFNNNAEEAVTFYTSVFKNSRITSTSRYGDAGPGPKGSVMVMSFELEGQQFMALNGGPHYQFTPAISLMVNCEAQEEIDELWNKLTEGGQEVQCGWLTDKFGLSWQIVPANIGRFYRGDAASASRVMKAMMPMKKLDMNVLQAAYNGE